MYDPDKEQFTPYTQAFRQCVPLHPHSLHPSKKLVEKTCQPSELLKSELTRQTLKHLIDKYVPALYRLGHNATEVVTTLTDLSYFLTKTTKEPVPYLPTISYAYSNTRPTIQQLLPIAKHDFRLIPKIPLAPLKGLLTYIPL